MKISFYILLAVAVYLMVTIVKILTFDMDRLTEYGWGYLSGNLIVFAIVSIACVILYKKIYRSKF